MQKHHLLKQVLTPNHNFKNFFEKPLSKLRKEENLFSLITISRKPEVMVILNVSSEFSYENRASAVELVMILFSTIEGLSQSSESRKRRA